MPRKEWCSMHSPFLGIAFNKHSASADDPKIGIVKKSIVANVVKSCIAALLGAVYLHVVEE